MGPGGQVAFQTSFVGGGSGVVVGSPGALRAVVDTRLPGPLAEVTSHPAFLPDGSVTFYAREADGGSAVYATSERGLVRIDGSSSTSTSTIGPLGPTTNAAGLVAYRATADDGAEVIRVWDGATVRETFRSGRAYGKDSAARGERASDAGSAALVLGFLGLPVLTREGDTIVRARFPGEGAALLRASSGEATVVLQTGPGVDTIGSFPSVDDDGTLVTSAVLAGRSTLVRIRRSGHTTLVAAGEAYTHVRGGIVRGGHVAFFAGTGAAPLGVYVGPDPTRDRIVALGEARLGSIVTDLALNPVSIGPTGALAIRVALADGSEAIFQTKSNR